MSNVAIVTDSTNYLPPDLVKGYNISVAPVGLVIIGKAYRANE